MSSPAVAAPFAAGHTSGPWEWERHSDNGLDTPVAHAGCVYGGGWNLALVFADGGISREAAEANARLMVSAPDLLEVLKGVVRWHAANAPSGLIERAVAAIAKAEGR